MSPEAEVGVILKILKIDDINRVATVTELGVESYLNHPDSRVRKAIREYLAHPAAKPIALRKKEKIPA